MKKKPIKHSSLLVGSLLAVGVVIPINAEVLEAIGDNTLLQNITPNGGDTGDAEDNFGGRTEVIIGNNGANPRHGLLRFDVSSLRGPILEGATLNTAILTLHERSGRDALNGDSTTDFSVYALVAENKGWVQGTKVGSAGGFSGEHLSSSFIYKATPSGFGSTDGIQWFSQGGGPTPSGALPTPSVFTFGTDTGPTLGTGTFTAVEGTQDTFTVNLDLTELSAVLPQWVADGSDNAGLIIEAAGTAQRFFESIEGAPGGGITAATLELVFDPFLGDADYDRILDVNETNTGPDSYTSPVVTGTDPALYDTDGDGISDGDEIETAAGTTVFTDPTKPDTDDDGLPDLYEIDNQLDPGDASGDNGASGDPDGDLLPNIEEFDPASGTGIGSGLYDSTDPQVADADMDNLNDREEIYGTNNVFSAGSAGALPGESTDPANPDSDNDGVDDGVETSGSVNSFLNGVAGAGFPGDPTDPNTKDTDGDGRSDDFELSASPQTDPSDSTQFPPTVPVAYWPLDEADTATVAPELVGGHDGVATNSPLWTTGMFGNAADIQGDTSANQWFQTPTIEGLVGSTSLTVSCWINVRSTNTGYRGILTTRGEGPTANENWGLNIERSNGNTDNRVPVDANGGSNGVNNTGPEAGGVFLPDTWYHIAMTYDGATGDVKTYTNGVLGSTDNFAYPTTLTGEGWNIGMDLAVGNRDFGGLIDDAALFPFALTDAEILNIYEKGSNNGLTVGNIYGLTAPSVGQEFLITTISHDPAAGTVDLIWNSNGLAANFQVVTSPDLSSPIDTWTDVGNVIPNAGETTSIQLTGQSDSKAFYAIKEVQ